MSEELKLCPFCKTDVLTIVFSRPDPYNMYHLGRTYAAYVQCANGLCKATGPVCVADELQEAENKARKAWGEEGGV